MKIWLINNSPFMVRITKINAFKETFADEAFLYGERDGQGQ